MEYKLTVIMSNYNQEKFIKQAIDSVLSQKTNFDFLLLITDDCSRKDNSVKIIKEYEQKYPNKIKALYNNKNGRYLENILRAKRITKTKYFTLLDADDYWIDNNYLQKAVDFLDKNPEFTIFNTNVVCLYEDGTSQTFLPESVEAQDFSFEDYFNGNFFCTQTTGMVFRNVIFSKGIPKIMEDAVGTISERSFEGDWDRYFMHLQYGKAHYENFCSGVYRILSQGIWSRLNDFEKCAIQAQCYIDHNIYLNFEYNEFYLYKIYTTVLDCLDCLKDFEKHNLNCLEIGKEAQEKFFSAYMFCIKNQIVLNELLKCKRTELKKRKLKKSSFIKTLKIIKRKVFHQFFKH